jgi:hypothetical protein
MAPLPKYKMLKSVIAGNQRISGEMFHKKKCTIIPVSNVFGFKTEKIIV